MCFIALCGICSSDTDIALLYELAIFSFPVWFCSLCVFCFSDVLISGNWSDAAALLRHYEHYFFLEKHVCAIAHREIISIFLTYLS